MALQCNLLHMCAGTTGRRASLTFSLPHPARLAVNLEHLFMTKCCENAFSMRLAGQKHQKIPIDSWLFLCLWGKKTFSVLAHYWNFWQLHSRVSHYFFSAGKGGSTIWECNYGANNVVSNEILNSKIKSTKKQVIYTMNWLREAIFCHFNKYI